MPIQQQLNILVQMTWGKNKACIILYPKFDDNNYPFHFPNLLYIKCWVVLFQIYSHLPVTAHHLSNAMYNISP